MASSSFWWPMCSTSVFFRLSHSHLILSLITRWLAILAFSSYRGIVGHITTMMDYAQIHIFDACGHYKGRLLLILILHNVMHDITSTLPVDVAPSARFTQNGRPMSIAGGRQEWFGYYWLWLSFSPFLVNKPFHSSSISCSSCLAFATRARPSA